MISIQPKWCELIAKGKKTIEVRKTRPKIDIPFKCYIYCTKGKENEKTCFGKYTCHIGNGKVIGEFVCDGIYGIFDFLPYDADDIHHSILPYVLEQTCLQDYEIDEYLGAKDGYGWHISDLVIYDKPRDVGEFYSVAKSGSDCCVGCIYHETPLEENPCRSCDGERNYLYRPPQSWQYVEEKENEK